MKDPTSRIIGLILILIGLSIKICFIHIIQFYTLINTLAIILLIFGIILVFKELIKDFKLFKRTNENKILRTIRIITQFILVVILAIGLDKLGNELNERFIDKMINSNTRTAIAKFKEVINKPDVYSAKTGQTKFYVFEYSTENEKIINGLNEDRAEKLMSKALKIDSNSITWKINDLSVQIEYSDTFPTMFRIR